VANWPTLSKGPTVGEYADAAESLLTTMQAEQGADHHRLAQTVPYRNFEIVYMGATDTDYDIVYDFEKANAGSWFEWVNPLTGLRYTVHFTSSVEYEPRDDAQGYWKIAVKLRGLPLLLRLSVYDAMVLSDISPKLPILIGHDHVAVSDYVTFKAKSLIVHDHVSVSESLRITKT
jgi:hypothetical protein